MYLLLHLVKMTIRIKMLSSIFVKKSSIEEYILASSEFMKV